MCIVYMRSAGNWEEEQQAEVLVLVDNLSVQLSYLFNLDPQKHTSLPVHTYSAIYTMNGLSNHIR